MTLNALGAHALIGKRPAQPGSAALSAQRCGVAARAGGTAKEW